MEEKLSLNDLAIAALRESAKWCMFLSIVGFIFIGLMVLFGGIFTVAMPSTPYDGLAMTSFETLKGYIGVMYIILAVLYFMPVYYLYNYAKGTKQALDSGNSEVLTNALVNLKSHHKFFGIMTIIMIALYILMFIVGIIFAVKYASAGM